MDKESYAIRESWDTTILESPFPPKHGVSCHNMVARLMGLFQVVC